MQQTEPSEKPEMIQVSKDVRSQSQGRLCLKSLEYLTETKESSEGDAVYTPCNSQGSREAVETRWYLRSLLLVGLVNYDTKSDL